MGPARAGIRKLSAYFQQPAATKKGAACHRRRQVEAAGIEPADAVEKTRRDYRRNRPTHSATHATSVPYSRKQSGMGAEVCLTNGT